MSSSPNHLQHLGQLARDYDRKYRELEQFVQNAQPEDLVTQLKLLGERTTDRFRSLQQILFAMPAASENPEHDKHIEAIVALCSCFDEMRILFQILLQNVSQA